MNLFNREGKAWILRSAVLVSLLAVVIFPPAPAAQGVQGGPAAGKASTSHPLTFLTAEERAWLRDHPVIRLAHDPGWPPIEFTNERGELSGMSGDYLRLVEERLGVKFERVRNLTWQETYARQKRWEIDVATCVAVTPQRLEFWAFTKPYLSIPIVIAAQSDVPYIADMKELFGKRVALVEGYAIDDWVTKDFPEINLARVKDPQEGLALLQRGEVFAYIDNLLIIGDYQAKMRIGTIKIAGQTPYVNAQCMAVRKDWAPLAGILQKALESISEKQRDDIYRKWLPVRYEHGFNYTLLWQALGVFAAILLVLAYWNWTLAQEIKNRKLAEKKLQEQEQHLRLVTGNMVDALSQVNTERVIVYCSPSVERVFGIQPESLIGQNAYERVHPEDVERVRQQALKAVASRAATLRTEYRYLHGRGDYVWVESAIRLLFGENGEYAGVVIASRDISEKKLAEEGLRDSEERLRLALKGANQGIYDLNVQTGEAQVSPEYAAMLGYDPEKFHETNAAWIERLHPEDHEPVAAIYRDYLSGKIPEYRIEFRQRTKSGDWKWILSLGKIVEWDAAGQPLRMLGTHTEITERKLAEEALRQANLVVENSPVVLFRWRATEGWPVDMVSRNVSQFGYAPEELLSGAVPFAALVLPEDLGRVAREVHEYSASGVDRFQQEYRMVTKDGGVRWVDDHTVVERNVDGQITYYQGIVIDITERKRAEETRAELSRLLEESLNEIYVFDAGTFRFVQVNSGARSNLGYTMAELLSLTPLDLKPEFNQQTFGELIGPLCTGAKTKVIFTTKHRRKNKSLYDVEVHLQKATFEGRPVFVAIIIDVTDRKRAEEEKEELQAQLVQAQKMESVGRLAGGVAHDFNNMLSAILGHAELALIKCPPSEPLQDDLKAIQKAGHHSADLVRQLLAFARKQTVAPRVLDLNDTVAGMIKMLLRLMGEDIDLVWMPGAGLWSVRMDPSQIDQLLANLCVNARDAIAGVGKVTIETENVVFDEAYCALHPAFACGHYVLLAVSDDGCGMSPEALDHLFEPFFTTKEVGRGTGLGLATVYGIVKQNEGFINVYSKLGKGTTFKIYLPRYIGEAVLPTAVNTAETPKGRGETVLLVEDEAVILEMGRRMLEELGYRVLTAATPGEAIRQAKAHVAEIQLLISDVVMPEMDGRELAKSISKIKPGLKCLFISGYTANVIAHRGVLENGVHFLQKPFSMKDLAFKVHLALDG